MTFADTAIATYKAATAAQRTTLEASARQAMLPVLTDHTGKVVFDPKSLLVERVQLAEGIVVLSTGDGTFFLVRDGAVRLARFDAERWVPFTEPLASLAEVGKALA